MKSIFLCILTLALTFTLFSCKKKTEDVEEEIDSTVDTHICTYDARSEIIKPTCETGGYTLRTCICGKTKKEDETAALGHAWSKWRINALPSQNESGYMTRRCSNGHDETLTLPTLNPVDYEMILHDADISTSCTVPTSVSCRYRQTVYDDALQSALSIEFSSQYLFDHAFMNNYVYTEHNHYVACAFCSLAKEGSEEAHNILLGTCIVCGYVDLDISYTRESYGIAVSYHANDTALVIPDFYMDGPIQDEINRVKGIKSFGGNPNLRTLTIPASVEHIDDHAFEGCTGLERIYYNGTWDQWCSIDFGEMANPMNYAKEFYIANDYSYEKGSNVLLTTAISSISSHAFEGFTEINSLTIPLTINAIGSGNEPVFSPETVIVKVYYRGDYTDWMKISLSSRYSSPMQFTHNFYMTNERGEYYTLSDLVIPSYVTEIGDYQFIGNSSIMSVKFESALTQIGEYAFEGCTSLSSVDLSEGCEVIGEAAFKNCISLAKVFLPKDIKLSSASSFSGCEKLQSVYFGGDIGDWCSITFADAKSNPLWINSQRVRDYAAKIYLLSNENNKYYSIDSESITIPDTVTIIGDYQFYGFATIAEFTVPSSVTSIGDCAFTYCENLCTLVIPKTVTKIGENVLLGCNPHLEIHFLGTAEDWDRIEIDANNEDLFSCDRFLNNDTRKANGNTTL